MNIHIDSAIFQVQSQGGISRLWRSLLPALTAAMPEAVFVPTEAPDVFISTYYKRALLGVKSLVVCYDLIPQLYPLIGPYRSDSVDARQAIQEAHSIISISQMTADTVKRQCGRDSVVAYPGVADGFGNVDFDHVQQFQSFVGKPYILIVGRRGLYKNVQTLYQAWRLWPAAQSHKLLCIGGEAELPQDMAFVSRYKDDWMHMNLNDDDLVIAYAGASALVYPSIMEGFGLPLVEAMACGCPVICDGAMIEITGNAAIYCDATRPAEIAKALNTILDPAVRIEMAVRGTSRRNDFRWSRMAATMADVIRGMA